MKERSFGRRRIANVTSVIARIEMTANFSIQVFLSYFTPVDSCPYEYFVFIHTFQPNV